jgi:hypothetical protein
MGLIGKVCGDLQLLLQVASVTPVRTADITSTDVIHHEIWTSIKEADAVIVDLTGHNANVCSNLVQGPRSYQKQTRR